MLITILLWLVFGAIVGWIAGLIMKSKFTLVWNIILGIVGSVVGGLIAGLFGWGALTGSFYLSPGNLIVSIIGACIVIYVARLIKKS